ncbi:hypothetical protein BGX28_002088 [Mortierella sp. GBA30]|nr:hypothetical protein BGX28_002088 [Mortierella sp. GBA30]
MADMTAPVVLLNDKEQQWLDGAIKDKLLRLIEFNDIKDMQLGVASGGFGMIHSGRWRGMRVAVKVLFNPADFIQEVGIHKLVQDSENIVKFYGITRMKSTGDYGMVLQFAGKGSLRDYLSRHFQSLDWSNKMRLARDVAAGISFIHEDNICHHDLHSRNVLIDHSGRALITDFGLSRYVNHANSNNGVRGVVPYISPERLRNAPFDHSSDVYSLGVIMWELTSGHPPFDQDGENFMLPFHIMKGKREQIVSGTPVEYSQLYQQCWDGEPANRPSLPVILKELDSMLLGRNFERAEENGAFQPPPAEGLDGHRSLPTVTNPVVITTEPLRKSEPIDNGKIPALEINTNKHTSQVTSISPLVPRPHTIRNPSPAPPEPDADSAVDAQLSALLGPMTVHSPGYIGDRRTEPGNTTLVTPLRPVWIQGNPRPLSPKPPTAMQGQNSPSIASPRLPGAGYEYPGQGPIHAPIPTPVPAPVHVPPPTPASAPAPGSGSGPRRSPRNTHRSAEIPEMVSLEDRIPEKGGGEPYYVGQNHSYVAQPVLQSTPAPVNNLSNNSSSRNGSGPGNSGGVRNSNSSSIHNWSPPRDGRSRIKDFFTACRYGHLEAVQWHLAHGANVMEPYDNMSGRTPLHAAAMSDSFEVMKLLCEAAGQKLNLNEVDDGSQTPLHLLTHYGRENSHESLVYMLERGANPNAQDSERRTPLMTCFILKDNAQLVETLLDYGADPNIRCQENNALAEAAIRLRYQCVKVLLETDLSMSEQASLEHAMDVCYRVTESVNRNQVLSLLVRWKIAEGLHKRQTLAKMILNGSLQLGERRIDQKKIAHQVLASANGH